MLVERAFGQFLSHCQYERNLTGKTLKAYATDLRQFSAYLSQVGAVEVLDVDREVVRAFLQGLYTGYQPRSIKRKMATLKAFFTYLEYEDLIPSSPFRKLRIKVDRVKDLPRTMTLDTVRKLFAEAYALRDQAKGQKLEAATRDVALLELMFATGMRVGEVCGLRMAHVDLDQGSVRVMGKGRRERLVPICGDKPLDALRSYASFRALHNGSRQNGAPEFFLSTDGESPVSDQYVRALVRRLADLAGINQHITPHMFRHTIATLLLENGVDIRNIQALLGHSSISVTEIYVRVNEKAQREVIKEGMPR